MDYRHLSGSQSAVILALLVAQLFSAAAVRAQSTRVFFTPPVNLSQSPRDTSPYSVRMAMDARHNLNVLWADRYCQPTFPWTCTQHLWFRRSVDGGVTFSARKRIWSFHESESVYGPQIAVDAVGNINIVWEGTASGGWEIFFSRSVDGGATFSRPRILSNNAGNAVDPQLALDRLGNINVVWQTQHDLNRWNVWFSRSADGGVSFSNPTALCDDTDICNWPTVAVEPGGSIDVVWAKALCVNCTYEVFFGRSSDRGATFSASHNLSNSTEPLITTPGLVVDAGGNITVVWSKGEYWSSGNADVFVSRSSDEGTTFAVRNLSANQGLSYFPQVGIDAVGNINVLWLDDALGGIAFSRSVNGGADFSIPKNVATPPSSGGLDPYVAVANDGDINLVWGEGGTGIMFRRSTDGGATFSTPEDISSNAIVAFPQIFAEKSGNICALWFGESRTGIPDYFFRRGVTVKALHQDVTDLPATALKNRGHRRTLLNDVADAEQASASGNDSLAVSILEDLLPHVNGCGRFPDKDDWIVDCSEQLKIRTSLQTIIAGLAGQ
jgi:hypothetical protein